MEEGYAVVTQNVVLSQTQQTKYTSLYAEVAVKIHCLFWPKRNIF